MEWSSFCPAVLALLIQDPKDIGNLIHLDQYSFFYLTRLDCFLKDDQSTASGLKIVEASRAGSGTAGVQMIEMEFLHASLCCIQEVCRRPIFCDE